MFERFDARFRTFRERLDRSIRQIAHIAGYLMARRSALRKEPVPDPLHFSADQKFSRYFISHRIKATARAIRQRNIKERSAAAKY